MSRSRKRGQQECEKCERCSQLIDGLCDLEFRMRVRYLDFVRLPVSLRPPPGVLVRVHLTGVRKIEERVSCRAILRIKGDANACRAANRHLLDSERLVEAAFDSECDLLHSGAVADDRNQNRKFISSERARVSVERSSVFMRTETAC